MNERLANSLSRILKAIGNLTPTWRSEAALDEWSDAILEAYTTLKEYNELATPSVQE